MGEVYLAEHTLTQQRVAMKVVSPELMKIEGIRARFLKEARTMANLHHPNIVQLHNFFEEEGRFYMAVEFIEGESLGRRIKRGQMDPLEAAKITAAVAEGLGHAHTRPDPVIHRDIKPDNVLLGNDGRVVIIDFGIAKALGGEKLTRTGATVGTCEYMAPEQVVGETVLPATDVYALGITLYKALAGRVPFPQKSDSGFEVMRSHIEKEPPSVTEVRSDIPHWLLSVLERALAKQADKRFSTGVEMATAISAGLAGEAPAPEVDVAGATLEAPVPDTYVPTADFEPSVPADNPTPPTDRAIPVEPRKGGAKKAIMFGALVAIVTAIATVVALNVGKEGKSEGGRRKAEVEGGRAQEPKPMVASSTDKPTSGGSAGVSPAVGAQTSSPAVGAQASSPAVGAQASSPAVGAQASSPAVGAQASSPAQEKQASPADGLAQGIAKLPDPVDNREEFDK